MAERFPITIFYDASCELCRAEIEVLKSHDVENCFDLVDCSPADFDDSSYRNEGITREAMMNYLHARDGSGEWFVGVDAFELLYRTVGLSAIASLWGGRLARPVSMRIYPWIARHRQLISMSGLPLLFRLWSRCAAQRSHHQSRRCANGKCTI